MRAVSCVEYGSHHDLIVAEAPDPIPGPDQVLIDVKAASLNFPDLLVIRGSYQFKPEPPFVPGAEAAGIVIEVGDDVETLTVGQKVASVGVAGGFASRRVVDAKSVIPLPDEADLELASATTMTYATSYHALVQRAQLKEGETLLVLGASGGVGSAAIEIGKALGATVIAAASTDDKLRFCSELGADLTINYTDEDLKNSVRDLTDGRGADVVYDPVGGALTESAFRSIAWNGRHLVVGFTAGEIPRLPLNLPLLKGAAVIGVFWGSFTAREPKTAAANLAAITSMMGEGTLRPRITKRFDLEQVIDAYELLATREAIGKIVLTIG